MDVITIAFKDVMFLEPDLDVQITCRATVGAWFAVACAANAHAAVNARWNFDFQRFLPFDLALSRAPGAKFRDHLAGATAGGAGLLHAEKALSHLHGAGACASTAGLDRSPRLGAGAFAEVAGIPAGDTDLGIFALGRFFQCDFHGVAQIAATKDLPSTTSPSASALLAKHVAKNVTKGFCESAIAFTSTWAAAHIGVNSSMTMLVIGRALLRVRQHLVCFFGFLELFFSYFGCITLIAV